MRWLLLLLFGCGRIGFGIGSGITTNGDGGHVDDTGSPGDDAPPGDSGPVTELCNGVDDTGDGVIDEGCPCTPFTTTPMVNYGSGPIAWTGSELLIPANGGLVRIGATGAGSATLAVTGSGSQWLAWSGSTLGMAYSVPGPAYKFRTVDPTTGALGPERSVATDGTGNVPMMIWTGTHFAYAWLSPPNLVLYELDATGTVETGPITIAINGAIQVPELLATPTGYAVAWSTGTTGFVTFADRPSFATHGTLLGIVPATAAVGPTGVMVVSGQQYQLVQFDGQLVAPPSVTMPLDLIHATAGGNNARFWISVTDSTGGIDIADIDNMQTMGAAQAIGALGAYQDIVPVAMLASTATTRFVVWGYDDGSAVPRMFIARRCP